MTYHTVQWYLDDQKIIVVVDEGEFDLNSVVVPVPHDGHDYPSAYILTSSRKKWVQRLEVADYIKPPGGAPTWMKWPVNWDKQVAAWARLVHGWIQLRNSDANLQTSTIDALIFLILTLLSRSIQVRYTRPTCPPMCTQHPPTHPPTY